MGEILSFCKYKQAYLILVICFSSNVFSQNVKMKMDTSYIQDYTHYVLPRIGVFQSFTKLTFEKDNSSKKIEYKPNEGLSVMFGTNIRSVYLAASVEVSTKDKTKYGNTNGFDIQLNMYSRKILAEIAFQRFRGLYLSNPTEVYTNYNLSIFPFRRDIRFSDANISALYIVNNKKMSVRAAFNQLEKQKIPTGSLLVGGGIRAAVFNADSALLTFSDTLQNRKPQKVNFRFISVYGKAGYGYLYTYKHFFVYGQVVPGIGVDFQRNNDKQTEVRSVSPSGLLQLKLSTGFNAHKWIISLYGGEDFYTHFSTQDKFRYSTGKAQVSFGWRFNEPKKYRNKKAV